MIKIGLIGFGYWGPNLARNFSHDPGFELAAVCDFSADRLERARRLHPAARLCSSLDDFFQADLDAVAIATPVATHFDLARRAIESGRHVWLEKPMTETVAQAEALIELARKKQKVLLVDHTFVYTGAVRKIKELVDQGRLGDLVYYDSTRVNLGLFQQDVNVIWDLAPHDISIMDFLMPSRSSRSRPRAATTTATVWCPSRFSPSHGGQRDRAHQRDWVSSVQIHQMLIGGTGASCSTTTRTLREDQDSTTRGWISTRPTRMKSTTSRCSTGWATCMRPNEDHEALALETWHFRGPSSATARSP